MHDCAINLLFLLGQSAVASSASRLRPSIKPKRCVLGTTIACSQKTHQTAPEARLKVIIKKACSTIVKLESDISSRSI
eukprot:658385-Amphidinium_carterae.1